MRVAIILCLFITSLGLYAQTKEKSLAERLFIALDSESQINSMSTNILQYQKKQLSTLKIPEQARPVVEQKFNELFKLIFDSFKQPYVRENYINAFNSIYTQDELKSVVNFFESSAGQAYIKKSPQLQKYYLKTAQEVLAKIKPKQQIIWGEIKNEINKYSN